MRKILELGLQEAGDDLEKILFGGQLVSLTYDAAEHLVSKKPSDDPVKFLTTFHTLNIPSEGSDNIKLTRKKNSIMLGRC